MAVRVLIKRSVPRAVAQEKEDLLMGLILRLRAKASQQPGYISGETMLNVDNPEEYLVISTWQSLQDWKAWLGSEERALLQGQIDELLGQETKYEVYHYPGRRYVRVGPEEYLSKNH